MAEALRVADVTCDGSPDVVVSGIEGSLMVGGRGGDGSVLGSLVRKGNVPGSNAATFGDIDRDGRLDAVVSNFFGTAQITRDVCRNGFAVQQRIRTIFASETTALVDLTGDGYPELVAVGWFSTGIAVARNLGAVAG
ncbi:MAG: VCBS repeat-containing protein [Solirubrobacteraceae bacterium]|nr:VCBS repeat-containing protein [Solirubrobacteraceae bacterium]